MSTIWLTPNRDRRGTNEKGALAYMLAKYQCLHLFPVASKMAASMPKALFPSGAKDDPRDSDLESQLPICRPTMRCLNSGIVPPILGVKF